jgi:hypothetical protein
MVVKERLDAPSSLLRSPTLLNRSLQRRLSASQDARHPRVGLRRRKPRSIWRFEFAEKKIVAGISCVAEPCRVLYRLNSFRPRRRF